MLLSGLKENLKKKHLSSDVTQFTNNVVCNSDSKLCMTGNCEKCSNKIEDYKPAECDAATPITYYQWRSNEKMEKVKFTSKAIQVYQQLKEQLKPFLIHVFIKRSQAIRLTRPTGLMLTCYTL